ncbi:MAG: hypothetical protein ACRD4Q_01195 [Candidatus Acidiferrales bacterium]
MPEESNPQAEELLTVEQEKQLRKIIRSEFREYFKETAEEEKKRKDAEDSARKKEEEEKRRTEAERKPKTVRRGLFFKNR